ncbi:hypothetical protein BZA77DRAFT_352586 [Pyronema omphalodes]|nr:hypothetical protein BZA77DRAFT_362517 [Pyronema omphalodes]KAI5817637.1 hypothetical protein BZA77DRAFT_352586 [Pyronema omphalodes]
MQPTILLPLILASLSSITLAAPAPAPAAAAAASNTCHWHVYNAATKATDNKLYAQEDSRKLGAAHLVMLAPETDVRRTSFRNKK